MSRGDATPRLGERNPTLHTHLSFPLTKAPSFKHLEKAHVLVQPTSRVSEIAAEVAYKGERCAVYPSTLVLTLIDLKNEKKEI